jgi:hypothetical protein
MANSTIQVPIGAVKHHGLPWETLQALKAGTLPLYVPSGRLTLSSEDQVFPGRYLGAAFDRRTGYEVRWRAMRLLPGKGYTLEFEGGFSVEFGPTGIVMHNRLVCGQVWIDCTRPLSLSRTRRRRPQPGARRRAGSSLLVTPPPVRTNSKDSQDEAWPPPPPPKIERYYRRDPYGRDWTLD